MLNAQQQEELATHSETFVTKRITVPALEEILFHPLPVLDHGFIRLIDYMGSDASIVQAARVSYGKGTKKRTEDRGLIFYLMRHQHTTPFEMCEIKLHVKLPIFVARQWIRHRTANVNEYSARYSIMEDAFYIPKEAQLATQSATNRQGRGSQLSKEQAHKVQALLREDAERCYQHYREMLNVDESGREKFEFEADEGLTRELARMNLTLNYYTEWYWKIDLHNLMHFVALRADSHAQWEIQAYAKVLRDILHKWTPLTAEAFGEYREGGVRLSASALKVIQRRLEGEVVTEEDSGLSKREWNELQAKFRPLS